MSTICYCADASPYLTRSGSWVVHPTGEKSMGWGRVLWAAIVLVMPVDAIASDWRYLGDGRERHQRIAFFLDAESLIATAGSRRIWFMQVGQKQSASMLEYQFSCNDHRLRPLKVKVLDRSANVIETSNAPGAWRSPTPDAVEAEMVQAVCGGNFKSLRRVENPQGFFTGKKR